MRCNVLSCEYNNERCLKDDEAILSEGGDGIYCNCYSEKLSIRLSKFKLIEADINDSKQIIVMATSYESISGLIKEILGAIENQYKQVPNKLIFDYTCKNGTKDVARYLHVDIIDGKIKNIFPVIDKELRKELKKITCNELKDNNSFINRSILNSSQINMIKKGIVI